MLRKRFSYTLAFNNTAFIVQSFELGEDGEAKKDKEKDVPRDTPRDAGMEAVKEASLTGRKSTPEPRFDPEKYEPVVKTPPEPTRVKSPDQVGKWVGVASFIPIYILSRMLPIPASLFGVIGCSLRLVCHVASIIYEKILLKTRITNYNFNVY